MGKHAYSKVRIALLLLFDRKFVEDLAIESGFLQRRRKVLPFELLLSSLSAFSKGRAGTFAQIWREYSKMTGVDVAYKPFHNQLVKPEFETFTQEVAEAAMRKLSFKSCRGRNSALRKFDDILVQDGSGFCVHNDLKDEFPRRFGNWGGDAALEVHATMSLLTDQLTRASITADAAPERPHLPSPEELENKLILGDRGYQSHAYGVAVKEAGGDVLIRCQTPNPQTLCYWEDGQKVTPGEPRFFKDLLADSPESNFDLNANYPKLGLKFRTVSLWIKEKCSRVTLMTTLCRRSFPAPKIGELYRARWQIEILFKEMKSHAGLGKWVTRKDSLVRSTIWLSVIVTLVKRFLAHASMRGGNASSTLRCAEILESEMPLLMRQLLVRRGLVGELEKLMSFLKKHGARAHPRRDRKEGRYSYAFAPIP